MATQFNTNTFNTKAMGYSRKNPSQTGDSGGGDMEFPRVLKNVEIPGVN